MANQQLMPIISQSTKPEVKEETKKHHQKLLYILSLLKFLNQTKNYVNNVEHGTHRPNQETNVSSVAYH